MSSTCKISSSVIQRSSFGFSKGKFDKKNAREGGWNQKGEMY